MVKKIFLVGLVLVGVIVTILLLTGIADVFIALVGIAEADASAGNYSGYSDALGIMPMLLIYAIPLLVGVIAVAVILRAPESHGRWHRGEGRW